MSKFKMIVGCYFEIEVEADDIEYAKEYAEMSTIDELLSCKTDESIEYIWTKDIKEMEIELY